MFVNSDFSDLLRLFNANGVEYLAVFFISRQDLITAKRASGRPQDMIDADLLSQPSDS
jgi:hypothetical protein